MTFLGFEINTEDNFKSIPDSKLKHLLAWSIPSCKAELNSFLCVCTYYGMVVPFVRLLAVPLLHLLKSSADFHWTNTEQISFENIMYLAIMSIKVYFPEKNLPMLFTSDASKISWTAALFQEVNGTLRLVYVVSRLFDKHSLCQPPCYKEMMGFGAGLKIMQHLIVFHPKVVICLSDASGICYLTRSKGWNMKSNALSQFLQQFSNLVFFHIPGKLNILSDILSRIHLTYTEEQDTRLSRKLSQIIPRLKEKPYRWLTPNQFQEMLKREPQNNELDITFFKNSNYKLMPNVEAIYDFIKHEKPEKVLFKEILNVWDDKYSTSEYQEVLALQKTNILSKAKRFKEKENSEILRVKNIENDKKLKSNLSCTSNVAQTRSKTKLSEQKEQGKPVKPELDQQAELNNIVKEHKIKTKFQTQNIEEDNKINENFQYESNFEDLTDPETIHIFVFTINTILKLEYLIQNFEKYHDVFHLTESYLTSPKKTKYNKLIKVIKRDHPEILDNLTNAKNDYIWVRPSSKKFPLFITSENEMNIRQAHAEDLLDIKIPKSVTLPQFQVIKIDFEIRIYFPAGYRGQLLIRSSLAQKGIMQLAGVIDSHYMGNLHGLFINLSHKEVVLKKGEYVSQLEIMKNVMFTPIELPKNIRLETDRNTKGFGSTNTLSTVINENATQNWNFDVRHYKTNQDKKKIVPENCKECAASKMYNKMKPKTKKCNITNNSNIIDKEIQIQNLGITISNTIASYLSQSVTDDDNREQQFDNSQFTKRTVQKLRLLQNLVNNKGVMTQSFFKDLQNADFFLRKIRDNILESDNKNKYNIINGIIHKQILNNITKERINILCVPEEILKIIVTNVHYKYLVHPSPKQTLKVIKTLVYHPNMTNISMQICKNCIQCIMGSRQNLRSVTGSVRTHDSDLTLETIYIDHVPNLPRTKEGKTAILIIVDYTSNYTIFYATRDLTGSESVKALTIYVQHFGPPRFIVSDNSKSFINEEIDKFCTLYSIQWRFNRAYNQQQNIAEKGVDFLKQQLNRVIQNPQMNIRKNWVAYLPLINIGINRLLYQNLFTRKQLLFGINHYDALNNLPFVLTPTQIEKINPISVKRNSTNKRRNEIKEKARLKNMSSKFFVNQIVIFNHPVTETVDGSKKLLPKNRLFHKIVELSPNGATIVNLETGIKLTTHYKFLQIPEVDNMLDIYKLDITKTLSKITTAQQKLDFKREIADHLVEEEENDLESDDTSFAEHLEVEKYHIENDGTTNDSSSATNLLINTKVNQKIKGIQSTNFEKLKKKAEKNTKIKINLDLQLRTFLKGSIITDREHVDSTEILCFKSNDNTSLKEKMLFTMMNVKDFSLKEITMLK